MIQLVDSHFIGNLASLENGGAICGTAQSFRIGLCNVHFEDNRWDPTHEYWNTLLIHLLAVYCFVRLPHLLRSARMMGGAISTGGVVASEGLPLGEGLPVGATFVHNTAKRYDLWCLSPAHVAQSECNRQNTPRRGAAMYLGGGSRLSCNASGLVALENLAIEAGGVVYNELSATGVLDDCGSLKIKACLASSPASFIC